MRSFTLIIIVSALFFITAGCLFDDGFYEPSWYRARPLEAGYWTGVGTCGETSRPGLARKLAIQRAMKEICYQAKGSCEYDFELVEEEDGSLSLKAKRDDRIIHSITGFQLIEELVVPEAKDGFTQDMTFVLMRIQRNKVPW